VTGRADNAAAPHGFDERNAAAYPYQTRGLKTPGLYREMESREPVVNQGIFKLGLGGAATEYEWPHPADANPDEIEFGEAVIQNITGTPHIFAGGFSNLMRAIHASTYANGFALAEKVFSRGVDGLWRYRLLKWIKPWQVSHWLMCDTGEPCGAVIVSRGGMPKPVTWFKLAHWARNWDGTNPEGDSGLRPLIWISEAKRQALLRDEMSDERHGPGLPWARFQTQIDDGDKAALLEMLDNLSQGKQRYAAVPETVVEFGILHGGAEKPDIQRKLNVLNQELSRGVDDQLAQVGASQYGSRALSETVQSASDATAHGMAILHGDRTVETLVEPLYILNQRDRSRMVGCRPSGFADFNELRALAEFARLEGIFSRAQLAAVADKILDAFNVKVPKRPAQSERTRVALPRIAPAAIPFESEAP